MSTTITHAYATIALCAASSQSILLSATSQLSPLSRSTHVNVLKITLVTAGRMKFTAMRYTWSSLAVISFFLAVTAHGERTAHRHHGEHVEVTDRCDLRRGRHGRREREVQSNRHHADDLHIVCVRKCVMCSAVRAALT